MHKANQELSYFSTERFRNVLSGLLLAAAIGSATTSTFYIEHVGFTQDAAQIIENPTANQEQKVVVPGELKIPGTSDRAKYEVATGDTVWDIAQKFTPSNSSIIDYTERLSVLNGISLPPLHLGAILSAPSSESLHDLTVPDIRIKFTIDDPELIELIKDAEGTADLQSRLSQTTMYGTRAPSFRRGKFYPYRDPHGNYTIGYGHLISKTRSKVSQHFAAGITKQEADKLLRSDMERVYSDFVLMLQKKRAFNLPKEVQMALFEMTYNMGSGGVANFSRMWSKLRKGQYQHASRELKNSAWSKQIQKDRFDRLTAMISMKEYL